LSPSAPTARLSTFAALRGRNYSRYWFGLVFYVLGHRAEYMTYAWITWEVSRSPMSLAYLGLAQGVPLVLFQLFGGVRLIERDAPRPPPEAFGGRIDALVNNAGWNISIPFPDLETLDAAVWDRLFATNLRGPYLLARAAAPHLKASGSGRIVNIASVAGLNPGGSSIGYATSKAGLIHLTRCLAVALAPQVSVNCVAPGLMDGTRMTSRLRPEQVQGALQRAVLKRPATVEDVADQVLTFCKSDSVTGQTVNIDAGVFFH